MSAADSAPTMRTPSSFGQNPVDAFRRYGVDLTRVDPMMFASLVRHVRSLMAAKAHAAGSCVDAERSVLIAAEMLVDWNEIEVVS